MLRTSEEDESLYGAVITFIRLRYAAGLKKHTQKKNPKKQHTPQKQHTEETGKLLIQLEMDSKEFYLNAS